MEKIHWNESYRIGVAILDRQHQHLFLLHNRLVDAQLNGANPESFTGALGEITEYYQHHFDTEEGVLAEIGYPDSKGHAMEHRQFIQDVVEICMTSMQGNEQIAGDLLATLSNWLKNHVLVSDLHIKSFIASNDIDPSRFA